MLVVLVAAAVAACGPAAQPDTAQATSATGAAAQATAAPAAGGEATAAPATGTSSNLTAPTTFVEPPFLADRVKVRKLPPIEQRLPEQPFVVGPGGLIQEDYMKWENGQYGGDINLAWQDANSYINIAGGSTILRSPSQSTAASRPSSPRLAPQYSPYRWKRRSGRESFASHLMASVPARLFLQGVRKD